MVQSVNGMVYQYRVYNSNIGYSIVYDGFNGF